MIRCIIIAALALLPAFAALSAPGAAPEVYRLTVSYSETDPLLPWQRLKPGTRAGYALRTDATHFVTTESLVRNAQVIHVSPARSSARIRATVLYTDVQVNLAILRLAASPIALPPTGPPPAIAPLSGLKTNMLIAQFDETDDLQTGPVQFLKSAVAYLPGSPHSCLLMTLQTQINVNGEGAPVYAGSSLAGLVMSYDPSTRTASVLPAFTADRFIRDALTPPYEGFASLGIEWAPLVDPVKRDFLGAPTNDQGILVLDCLPASSAAGVLQPDDVIVELCGFPVDGLGYYTDPVLGRMEFACLIKELRSPGDVVPARIIRDRKPHLLDLRLARRTDASNLIPDDLEETPADYLITGGLIIRELSGRYLRTYGSDWPLKTDPRIVHDYFFRRHKPEQAGSRIVILSRVLPDPINQGYQHMQDAVITHVNDQPIRNMEDVFAIAARDTRVSRLRVRGMDTDLCLDTNTLAAADERLARQYRLPDFQRHARGAAPIRQP